VQQNIQVRFHNGKVNHLQKPITTVLSASTAPLVTDGVFHFHQKVRATANNTHHQHQPQPLRHQPWNSCQLYKQRCSMAGSAVQACHRLATGSRCQCSMVRGGADATHEVRCPLVAGQLASGAGAVGLRLACAQGLSVRGGAALGGWGALGSVGGIACRRGHV
jgi:hypothetical protein